MDPENQSRLRSHSRFAEELRRHMPDKYDDIIEKCATEVQPHRADFKDKSKLWDVAHHIADALQSERFGDTFIASIFYQQSARDIIESGETHPNNLLWAKTLITRAENAFNTNRAESLAPTHKTDQELKNGIVILSMEIDLLIGPQLPEIRE